MRYRLIFVTYFAYRCRERGNGETELEASEIAKRQLIESLEMSHSRDGRSPLLYGIASPPRRHRSRSRSLSRSERSRSRSQDASNRGNNLYVNGLSTRVTASDLEKFFSKEGKVIECQLVTDPRSKESRGFGFVTMETADDAERCIKHLNRSVLEGRLITVEKAKRSRGRTPTPGRYQGLKDKRAGWDHGKNRDYSDRNPYSRRRGRSRSPHGRKADDYYDRKRR